MDAVTLYVSCAVKNRIGFCALLNYQEHVKTITSCSEAVECADAYPIVAVMRGLQALKRACKVSVVCDLRDFAPMHEYLKDAKMLNKRLDALANQHNVSFRFQMSDVTDPLWQQCQKEALQAALTAAVAQ